MNEKNEQEILKDKIKKLDEQLALLSEIKQKCLNQLHALEVPSVVVPEQTKLCNFTPDEKISLYMGYFRGRSDIFARLWVNNRTGKKGYSPACKNEWVRTLCKKPAIKCSECPQQAFIPLDANAIRQHLSGGQVIGIYPMLQNETCYFLAMDFDKENWLGDLSALRKTCSEEGIPVAVEKSRSGFGGHGWIFFSEEVPAVLARKLGSYLITRTMDKRYQMDMKSYDRLFPNQDTLPKGGFGNLIALPFQKEAVRNGNTVFIDDNGNPHADQWDYLKSIRKISYHELQAVVDKGMKTGQIIAVRQSITDENDEPWMRLPSGKRRFKADIKDLPGSIAAVLSNRIYIKTEGIPSGLLNQLKHLAAFQNPEFYRKQKMRFSTHATPRVICCSEIVEGYLSLPRGCLHDIETLLNEYDVELIFDDKRVEGQRIECQFYGQLTAEQQEAFKGILSDDFGVFVAPPGTGKTVVAIAAIAERKTNTLILVHRKPLMEQWRLQISALLGIEKKDIGRIGGGKNKSTGVIDIAMVQSMDDQDGVDDRIAGYGLVIVDECHHVSAFSFEKVLTQAKAKYVLGLTATPYRRDGHQSIIHFQCGPVCHRIKQKDNSEQMNNACVLARETDLLYEWKDDSKIHDLWRVMIADEQRNRMIVEDVAQALEEGRFPLILTERREHLEKLAELLCDKVDSLILLYGGLKQKRRRDVMDELKKSSAGSRKLIIATGSYIGEGFDEPRLDTLFLTMPSSFKGRIVQYAGRLHRQYADKQSIRIYDYVDNNVSVLSGMYRKRMKTYKMLGYSIAGQDPLGI